MVIISCRVYANPSEEGGYKVSCPTLFSTILIPNFIFIDANQVKLIHRLSSLVTYIPKNWKSSEVHDIIFLGPSSFLNFCI